ncbi:MAG: hypothetical protein KH321_08920 [Clostridium sp.]|nr:hypothetical protein [Clostridium sp.]
MTKLSVMPSEQTAIQSSNNKQMNKKKIQNIDFLKYAAASSTGAAIGYSIKVPDKDILAKAAQTIDGPDVVSGDRGGLLTKMKTKIDIPEVRIKIPDMAKRYKNALIGAFTGIVLVGLYNLLKPKK